MAGLLIAGLIIAGAVKFKDQLSPSNGADLSPVALEPALSDTAQLSEKLQDNSPASKLADIEAIDIVSKISEVRLLIGADVPPDQRLALIDALEAEGKISVKSETVAVPVAVSRIGYYHSEDIAAATDLANKVRAILDQPAESVPIRDYGNLLPDAEPGRLDIWVKG